MTILRNNKIYLIDSNIYNNIDDNAPRIKEETTTAHDVLMSKTKCAMICSE